MSRIGNQPVSIPKGVEVTLSGQTVTAKGPKGELSLELPADITCEVKDGEIAVSRSSEVKHVRALHGTFRSHIANMVQGVNEGYKRELEINGVGYKAQQQGQKLVLNLGFSHAIEYECPEGVNVAIKDGTKLEITGCDKQMVGQVGATIRGYSPAEPYKGKGVKYKDEQIRRKAGKTVA